MIIKNRTLKINLRLLLLISSILSVIGLLFIYSSSCIYASEKFFSPFYFLKKQIFYLFLSIIGFIVFASIPLSTIKKRSPLFFLFSVIGLILTFVPSLSLRVHGSNRWVNFFGFSFQPSEFFKIFLFLYIAFLFEKKTHQITSIYRLYLPFISILGISFVMLLKQPDFGSVVTIFITTVILFFVAGVRITHLFTVVLVSLPVAAAAIFLKSYRFNRILVFLNPWSDPHGRGYQIIQSLIAIGSGGFWGLGIANSKQKFFYLPMQHTDFIFSIIAEEMGLVGGIIIILLYVFFCYFGIRIVTELEDSFAFYSTLSFIVLISLEAVINLMVVTGLIPTKGLGLPFISYGGTALISNFIMLGLIANFVRNQELSNY